MISYTISWVCFKLQGLSQRLQKLHNISCTNPNCCNAQFLHHLPCHMCMAVKLAKESLCHTVVQQFQLNPRWVQIWGAHGGQWCLHAFMVMWDAEWKLIHVVSNIKVKGGSILENYACVPSQTTSHQLHVPQWAEPSASLTQRYGLLHMPPVLHVHMGSDPESESCTQAAAKFVLSGRRPQCRAYRYRHWGYQCQRCGRCMWLSPTVGDPSKIRPYSSLTGLFLSLFSLTAFSSRKPKNKRKAE